MVFKAIILVGLVALLAACGGGDADPDRTSAPEMLSGRLTLDEMRAWCIQFNERGEEKFSGVEETWGDAVEGFEWVRDELASVNPPEDMEEFWKAWQRGIDVAVSFTREKPAGKRFQIDELVISSEFMAADREWRKIEQALEDEVYDVASYCTG